jgi:hypothetical protein
MGVVRAQAALTLGVVLAQLDSLQLDRLQLDSRPAAQQPRVRVTARGRAYAKAGVRVRVRVQARGNCG